MGRTEQNPVASVYGSAVILKPNIPEYQNLLLPQNITLSSFKYNRTIQDYFA